MIDMSYGIIKETPPNNVITISIELMTMSNQIRAELEAFVIKAETLLHEWFTAKEALSQASHEGSQMVLSEIAGIAASDFFDSGRVGRRARKLSKTLMEKDRRDKLENAERVAIRRFDEWLSQVLTYLSGVSTETGTRTSPDSEKLVFQISKIRRFTRPETRLRHGITQIRVLMDKNLIRNEDLLKQAKSPKALVVMPGETFDALMKVTEIVSSAKAFLKVVDPWPGEETLVVLNKAPDRLPVMFLTSRLPNPTKHKEFELFARRLTAQKPEVQIAYAQPGILHDRAILTKPTSWSIGHSIKDIGKKQSTILPMSEESARNLEKWFDVAWRTSEPLQ